MTLRVTELLTMVLPRPCQSPEAEDSRSRLRNSTGITEMTQKKKKQNKFESITTVRQYGLVIIVVKLSYQLIIHP